MSLNQEPYQRGYKYRIYPTEDQKVLFEKTFGSVRYIWNNALARINHEYEAYKLGSSLTKPQCTFSNFRLELTKLKQSEGHEWLYDVSNRALQCSLQNLEEAFQKFFKGKGKVGYPQFKSKHKSRRSFKLIDNAFHVNKKFLKLAHCKELVKVKLDRPLPSEPSSVTISCTSSGEYYASFLCGVYPEMTNGQGKIGIDLGIKTLASQSNGIDIPNPKYYVKAQKKLTKLQRRLSKKQKGSKNRNKARIKVAKVHQHIANQRSDYLHKLSRSLVNDNQVIVIEDLNVKGMSKNHKLAKHILDAGMGMFRQMLTYKVIESNWCTLLIANRFYPSTQLCSNCGVRPLVRIKLGISEWTCQNCKTVHGRDTNAAKNLLKLAVDLPLLWENSPGKVVLSKPYKELISV
jgi:putative transposase